MIRVNIVVEGSTEEAFISQVLAPACWEFSVYPQARIVGEPGHKGGRISYDRVARDVMLLLKQEGTTYCTTMVDFYGLNGPWPGMPVAAHLTTAEKAAIVEKAVLADIVAKLSPIIRADARFRPYFQMHEFEALLFSDPAAMAKGLDRPDLQPQFAHIRGQFNCPEDIDDGPQSAPSKRIIACHGSYKKEKPLLGSLAALSVGLHAMRRACPRFNEWVAWLQGLGGPKA